MQPECLKYHVKALIRGKIASLLMLLIFLFNVCGYYICFQFVQSEIRREIQARIREGLDNSELTVITVSANDNLEVRWIKPDKEFTYHGSLYDVVKTELKNGKIVYHCINDSREKKLINDFNKKNESNQKSRKILTSHNTSYFAQFRALAHINEISDRDFYSMPFDYISRIKEVSDPPPKL
jgi:hypothetical protein